MDGFDLFKSDVIQMEETSIEKEKAIKFLNIHQFNSDDDTQKSNSFSVANVIQEF